MLLDDAMPRWDRRSTHRVATDTEPALLLAAVEEVTWREVWVFRVLMALRGFRAADFATNFRAVDGFLVTETRVIASDARSRRRFALYWLLIRAGSGVIRRVWLHAISSRAHANAAGRRSS
ncbi:hypothetical protein [Kribbella sp. CA-247076]|uniref:hypothetical protein n=1 Tax=Kribbella sp. CA-247076 TaxID=3239941 RepID=UPI003D91FB22